jgi:hypothetical protein
MKVSETEKDTAEMSERFSKGRRRMKRVSAAIEPYRLIEPKRIA